jgi:hypothetical protein
MNDRTRELANSFATAVLRLVRLDRYSDETCTQLWESIATNEGIEIGGDEYVAACQQADEWLENDSETSFLFYPDGDV